MKLRKRDIGLTGKPSAIWFTQPKFNLPLKSNNNIPTESFKQKQFDFIPTPE